MDTTAETLAPADHQEYWQKKRERNMGTRQRSNGHVRGARLDGVADLGVRVEEENESALVEQLDKIMR